MQLYSGYRPTDILKGKPIYIYIYIMVQVVQTIAMGKQNIAKAEQ